jgi:hypothetical protein
MYTVKLLSNKCLRQVVIIEPVELLFTATMLLFNLLGMLREKQPQRPAAAVAVKDS